MHVVRSVPCCNDNRSNITSYGNMTVATMLGMVPECMMSCLTQNVFQDGVCPTTDAEALSACICTSATIQSRLAACVQSSCQLSEQAGVSSFTAELCKPYPMVTRAGEVKSVAIATMVISTILLVLRLYSRWLKTSQFWLDDAFAIVAGVLLVSVAVVILQMSLIGLGTHYWNVSAENIVELLKLYYVCQLTYIPVQVFSKVSILALFSRLFQDFNSTLHKVVRGMIYFMFIHGVVFLLVVIFQCSPIRSIWDKTIDGKCIPIKGALGFSGAVLSIVEDFVILLLPIHEIWKLQMTAKKKAGIIFLISVGSFASVSSIIRLVFVFQNPNSNDSTWDDVDIIKWSLIEVFSACACGNLLPLRPLVDKVMHSARFMFSWYSDWSRKSSGTASADLNNSQLQPRHNQPSKKSNLISTLNFTHTDPELGHNWTGSRLGSSTICQSIKPDERHIVEDSRPRSTRRSSETSAIELTQSMPARSESRTSAGSERELVSIREYTKH
ncbi:hypothetical protein P153DRAFT_312509, partial [Dothidotthia symphoricarpi CBS 119687]